MKQVSVARDMSACSKAQFSVARGRRIVTLGVNKNSETQRPKFAVTGPAP